MREVLGRTIVIDLRCLQGAEPCSGVLEFVREFAALARPGRLLGLIDLDLPVPDESLVDEVRCNAYLPDLPPGCIFLNPVAHGADDLFIARLLLRDDILKIAVTGGALAAGLEGGVKAAWLKRYDVVAPGPDAASVWAEARNIPAHFAIGGGRPRVAMLTPLPPTRSGVADYSASVAKALERFVDVTLFAQASILPHVAKRFDRVVSVLGNSGYHSEIYEFHARYGGAVICHDSRLLHFFAGKLGLERTAAMAARELGRDVSPGDIELWLNDERQRAVICFGDLARTAQPLIVHARSLAARAGARYLPFAIYRPWEARFLSPAEKRAARARLGFGDERIIVSFGFINSSKGIDAAIAAMATIGGAARLVFVGQRDGAGDWEPSDNVTFLNRFIDEATYRDYLRAADCGLQLRVGAGGNVSGALQDCIAAGLPSVANVDLAEALDAPGYVRRVSDMLEPAEIALALVEVLAWGYDTEAERMAYAGAHDMEGYARGLCGILEIDTGGLGI